MWLRCAVKLLLTYENAEYVADHILTLLNSSELDQEEIQVLVSKLTDIANCEEISLALAGKALQIIDAFLLKGAKVSGAQKKLNSVLQLMEKISFKLDFDGRNESIVLPRLAMALVCPDPVDFQGLAFGVTSYSSNRYPELNIRQAPFTTAVASIFLPQLLKDYLEVQSYDPEDHTEIQFSFFGETSLFQDSSCEDQFLNSYVVGASLKNVSIQNLTVPVNIVLQHTTQNKENAQVYCVFWDFKKNSGSGGWNRSGCQTKSSGVNYTVCNCHHLTHFGVLLDVYREPVDNPVLTLITYTGCGISCIFLGLALIVYLSIDKLRGDYPSRILVNLCFALLMLNLTFLVDSWLASFNNYGLCISVAVFLHYFLLAAFTWMGLEAIHMYYALIKVFNTYIPRYILKFSIAGWGIPALIVAIVLAISPDFYGTRPVSSSASPEALFCWIKNDVVFYISTLAYFCLVFLINVGMFITVLLQIHTMNKTNPVQEQGHWGHSFLRNWKRVVSLTFLLGLTWGFAFFASRPVRIFFLYLFAVCNTLQGFFIFLFYCLMKENVRKQCRIHFCCGKFRLDYSQWSSSATALGYPSHPREQSSRSLKSYATSSTSNGSRSLPGSIPDIGVQTDQIWCNTDCTSMTYLKPELPCGGRRLTTGAELHGAHKAKISHAGQVSFQ
nr:adhesion G-protein coupled receptor G4 [Pogona vitticeps]